MRILALGDGNFAFSLALARQLFEEGGISSATRYLGLPHAPSGHVELIITSFDTYEELIEKYPESVHIIEKLNKFSQVRVLHRINAWELKKHFGATYPDGFDVIYWNHPHLGTENFRLHNFLMAHFLNSARSMLRTNYLMKGSVIISLVEGQETRWKLVEAAAKQSLALEEFLSFDEKDYPGYECKRNKNGQTFKNDHTKKHVGTAMRSFVYRFHPNVTPVETNTASIDESIDETVEMIKSVIVSTEPETLPTIRQVYDPMKARDRKWRKQIAQQRTGIEWQCPECEKTFTWFGGCHNHYHVIHELGMYKPETQIYHCELCPKKQFTRKDDFEQHLFVKHEQLSAEEQEAIWSNQNGNVDVLREMHVNGTDESSAQSYIPCPTCGQAVMDLVRDGVDYGMSLHLESLKPLIGMKMNCPLKQKLDADGRPICQSTRTFIDHRALEQHFRQCKRWNLHYRDSSLNQ